MLEIRHSHIWMAGYLILPLQSFKQQILFTCHPIPSSNLICPFKFTVGVPSLVFLYRVEFGRMSIQECLKKALLIYFQHASCIVPGVKEKYKTIEIFKI